MNAILRGPDANCKAFLTGKKKKKKNENCGDRNRIEANAQTQSNKKISNKEDSFHSNYI